MKTFNFRRICLLSVRYPGIFAQLCHPNCLTNIKISDKPANKKGLIKLRGLFTRTFFKTSADLGFPSRKNYLPEIFFFLFTLILSNLDPLINIARIFKKIVLKIRIFLLKYHNNVLKTKDWFGHLMGVLMSLLPFTNLFWPPGNPTLASPSDSTSQQFCKNKTLDFISITPPQSVLVPILSDFITPLLKSTQ